MILFDEPVDSFLASTISWYNPYTSKSLYASRKIKKSPYFLWIYQEPHCVKLVSKGFFESASQAKIDSQIIKSMAIRLEKVEIFLQIK